MPRKLILLTPVFDDWESLSELVDEITAIVKPTEAMLTIVVVDDGSPTPMGAAFSPTVPVGSCIEGIEGIRLASNLGHQRAIAVGLSSIVERYHTADGVIVMDCDGEDRPSDIPRLIAESNAHPSEVVLAHRARRSEGRAFKVGYAVYKVLFRILTGQRISFGNFCLLPMSAVHRLVRMSELWNNLPAATIRSRHSCRTIDTIRGVRYAGVSRMNIPSLTMHGLSAMSVYADIMFVRVLMAAAVISVLAVVAMAVVAAIRLATDVAIPGWATTVFGTLIVILFQSLVTVIATTFMVLATRSVRPFVPIADTGVFIAEIVMLVGSRPQADNRSAA